MNNKVWTLEEARKDYKKKKPIFSIYAKSCKDIVFTDEELEKRATDTINKFTTKQVVCNRVFKK